MQDIYAPKKNSIAIEEVIKGLNLVVHENKKLIVVARMKINKKPKIKPVNFLNNELEEGSLLSPFRPNLVTSKWTI